MIMRKLLIYTAAALALLSCTKERSDTLSGTDEKTPLQVGLTVQAGQNSVGTKAADMEFASGDKFVAYLRHVTWDGETSDPRSNVEADQAPQLVTFTKGSTAMAEYTGSDITPIGTGVALGMTPSNTKIATDVTPDHKLYWDDFSNSATAATDLRTEGHYLESYYGYCYNGGPAYGETGTHISTDLDQENGTLGWTIATDQSTGFQTSDLLWSAEQTPVRYNHTPAGRPGLILPFTHAMSKVTISIVCDTQKGFSADKNNFSGSSVVLKDMNTVCTLSAPNATVTASGTPADITMKPAAVDNTHRSFTALIPQNTFSDGLEFAAINNVDGNNYKIVLSDAVMHTSDEDDADWASKLRGYTDGTKSGTTLPGVHYMITVTIAKQEITVKATLQNWEDVTAEGVGVIQFAGDITGKGDLAAELQANGFAIYQAANASPINYTQTSVWSYAASKWTATPQIYWPNGGDKFYFRALSGYNTEVGEDLTMELGRDVLWATTPAHKGPEAVDPTTWNYAEGDPIAPRTGDVPLAFEHPMSKITVNLGTVTGDAAVELAGAHISIANIYDGGTIDLNDGSIGSVTASTAIPIRDYLAANDATAGTKLSDVVVIPQSLTTMADGTTPRDGAVSFYNAGELTEIDGHTYVTSSLEKVYYTAAEANTHNAGLTGAKSTSDIKTPAVLYTEETAAAHNATLDGAVHAGDPIYYTYDEFKALTNAQMTEVLFALLSDEQKKHLCTSAAEYNELTGSEITNEAFSELTEEQKTITYTLEQYKEVTPTLCPFESLEEENFNNLSAAARTKDVYTEDTAKTYNATLDGAVSAGQVQTEAVYYTQDEADAFNATLPGAIHEGDFKGYNATDASIEAVPGDLKTSNANPKIMMLIRLANEATYILDLASCKDSGDNVITEWVRGKHYTYTITLSKEAITFRALIKAWEYTNGSGNANLEWD